MATDEPLTFVEREDGYTEARIGDRVVLIFQLPQGGVSLVELHEFGEHILKLSRQRSHGVS